MIAFPDDGHGTSRSPCGGGSDRLPDRKVVQVQTKADGSDLARTQARRHAARRPETSIDEMWRTTEVFYKFTVMVETGGQGGDGTDGMKGENESESPAVLDISARRPAR